MESLDSLKGLGATAGIGGIAIGALTLVFRDVIRQKFFPTLNRAQAYRLIGLIVVLTFAVAIAGIAASTYVQVQQKRDRPITEAETAFPSEDPQPIVQSYLRLVDDGQYGDAYDSLSTEAHRRFQRQGFVELLTSQRKPLGAALHRTLYQTAPARALPDGTKGAFMTEVYVTNFEHAKMLEGVTVTADGTGWKPLFHQIAACAPPACTQ